MIIGKERTHHYHVIGVVLLQNGESLRGLVTLMLSPRSASAPWRYYKTNWD